MYGARCKTDKDVQEETERVKRAVKSVEERMEKKRK